MREVEYRLVKEDYKDWIHWNVERNYSEKKRRKTLTQKMTLRVKRNPDFSKSCWMY